MKKNDKPVFKLEHWHFVSFLLMIYDVIAVNAAYFFSLWVRFDCTYSAIPVEYIKAFVYFSPIYTVVCVAVLFLLRMYNSIWRFASFNELVRMVMVSVITSVIHIVGITVLFQRMPVSYYIIGMCIQFILLLGIRFSYRFILLERGKARKSFASGDARVMLIGAGNAGQMILRDAAQSTKNDLKICCIIDDNANKWGRHIGGVPVVGGRAEIVKNVHKYRIQKIFIAIPSALEADKREILNICKDTGCELKNLPGIYQLMNGQVTISDMRDVAVEDLLGRDAIRVNMDEIYEHISAKTIMVTVGGGSIGSELSWQEAAHSPKQLIIFYGYENIAHVIS